MVLVGTLLGSLVCAANMYFGLQIGSLDTMSQSTALISFAIFRGIYSLQNQAFTPTENVVVQALASSVASMPIAASLWSIIPAFEFLRTPEEGGARHFSVFELIIWSFGVSLFGTVFAAPFRSYFLLRERLRFPGCYATAVLVGAMHKDETVARNTDLDKKGISIMDTRSTGHADPENSSNSDANTLEHASDHGDYSWTDKVTTVVKAFVGTGIYVSICIYLCVSVIEAMKTNVLGRSCLFYSTVEEPPNFRNNSCPGLALVLHAIPSVHIVWYVFRHAH